MSLSAASIWRRDLAVARRASCRLVEPLRYTDTGDGNGGARLARDVVKKIRVQMLSYYGQINQSEVAAYISKMVVLVSCKASNILTLTL